LLIENEGPRPLFRVKLRHKLANWTGSQIGDRISVLERPWGRASLVEDTWRDGLAAAVQADEVDVLIAGPVTRLGMDEAGTLQQVRDFMAFVDELRRRSGRRLAIVLIHHENKGGKVSGAWEGSGDTLFHVSAQGHGRTRLHMQKVRWSSEYHKKTLQLRWAEGEGFGLEEQPELDDAAIAEQILEAISSEPGIGWTRVEETTPGVGRQRRRTIRNALLREGQIVNVAKAESGELLALDHCPERKPARLYRADDPTISHLRPDPGAAEAQTAPARAVGGQMHLRPAPRPIGAQGAGADDPPPPNRRKR
jgi:hypothetical protein